MTSDRWIDNEYHWQVGTVNGKAQSYKVHLVNFIGSFTGLHQTNPNSMLSSRFTTLIFAILEP
jgi:hypothetical protein